jgi:hypothetical protein
MNRRSFVCGIASCVGGVVLTSADAHADMSWSQYLALREQAPEVLQVIVNSVTESTKDEMVPVGPYQHRQRTSDVVARLGIKAVLRTASGLRPGDVITLRYQIVLKDTGFPAVWPPRLLKTNEQLKVYLQKQAEAYALAAMKASFES